MANDHNFKVKKGITFTQDSHQWLTGNDNNIQGKIGANGAAGLVLKDSANVFRVQLYGEGTNYGFLASEWGGWDLKKTVGGSLYLNNNTTYSLRPDGTTNLNNLNVAGNFTVSGTTTTLNTATLQVEDKNITLNYGTGNTVSTANGSGITIQDAMAENHDATILWDTSNDRFNFSDPVNVDITGPNNTPSNDALTVSGYGIIGNRGASVYVTNANSNGTVQIGVGGAHNANPKLTVSSSAATFTVPVTSTALTISSSDAQLKFNAEAYKIKGGGYYGDIRIVAPRFRVYEDDESSTAKFQIDGGNATFVGQIHLAGSSSIRSNSAIAFNEISGAAQTGLFKAVAAQTSYANSVSPGMFNALNGYAVGTGTGTTVIDSSRNLTNIGTISNTGKHSSSIGSNATYSKPLLEITTSATPTQIKITTNILYSGTGASTHAHSVTIRGFQYGSAQMADLQIGWHVYQNQFYNRSVTSSGSWAPTVTLAVENNKVVIHLASPGYWPKLYVESMYNAYGGAGQASGWSWSDAAISADANTPNQTVPYKFDYGNGVLNSGGTTVIDSSRNLTNIANISAASGHVSGKFAVKSTGVHNSYDFYNDGTSYFNGTTEVNAEFKISSSSSYITHFNYQDNGVNIISQANGGSTSIRNNNGNLFTLSSTGSLSVAQNVIAGNSSSAAVVRAHYNDGSYMTLEGFGLVMNRGSSYIRPSTDGDKVLYIGGADASLDWSTIHFRSSNGLYMSGTQFLTSGRALKNIAGITSSGTHTFTANDVDFIVQDTTDSITNYIWRDHSASTLYLGTQDAVVNIRSALKINNTTRIDMSGNATLGTISSSSITSTGLTVDYTGPRTGDAGILVTNDASDWGIKILKDGTTDYGMLVQTDGANAFMVRNKAGAQKALISGSTGNATFAGAITSTGTSTFDNFRLTDASKMGFGTVKAGATVGHTASTDEGIFWHTGNDYGIYRTSGGWGSPNYQQLKLRWVTGIELDGGTAYGKSGVNIVAGNFQIGGTAVIDSSRNLTNIGTISSGAITSSGNSIITGSGSTGDAFIVVRGNNGTTQALRVQNTGEVVVSGNYLYAANSGTSFYSQGTSVFRGTITNDNGNNLSISSGGSDITFNSKNFTSVGTISSGAITSTGTISTSGELDGATLDISGNAAIAGYLNFDGGSQNGLIRFNSNNAIGYSNNFLYINPSNHFTSGVYINSALKVDSGLIGSYNEDLQLRTANTTALTLSNTDQSATFAGDITTSGQLDIANPSGDSLIRLAHGAGNNYDAILEFSGSATNIATEGLQIWYDNSVGDAHFSTTFADDAAYIRFHTRTGASKSTSNERLTIAGHGTVGINKSTGLNSSYKLHMGGHIHMNNNHIHYANEVHFNNGTRFKTSNTSTTHHRSNHATSSYIALDTNGTIRGYVAGNSDGGHSVGLLDQGGSWGVRHINDQGTIFYSDNGIQRAAIGADLVSGDYGSMVVNETKSGWAGYSINNQWVFMAEGSARSGIYNDTDNEWAAQFYRNGQVSLYHNNLVKLSTTSSGIDVSGNVEASGSLSVNDKLALTMPSNSSSERGPWNPIISSIRSSGRMLYKDEEFWTGSNSIGVYNNAGGGTVTHTREADTVTLGADAPNGSGQVLRIYYNGGTASPGFGGFLQGIPSEDNHTFVQIFQAKLPSGKSLQIAENSQGSNNQSYFLTSNSGTGKWEWYARVSHCGDSGTFSGGGHIYVSGGSGAFTWYLASCTVYDVTETPAAAKLELLNDQRNLDFKTDSTGSAGLLVRAADNGFRFQLYGEGSNYGFLDGDWGNWDLKKTTNGKLTFNGNDTYFLQPEHANSAKFRQYVQIGDSSTYNSNSGSWGARLNVTDDVHSKIVVAQDADSMESHWYAHTGHSSIKFGTNSTHDVEFQRAGSTSLEIEAGGLMTMVPIRRNSHHASGFLEGSYNNVGSGNNAASNPIYTIGSSYNPAQTSLSNMYGVGFSKKGNATFLGDFRQSGWGLYVASAGTARVFLNAQTGVIASTNGYDVGSVSVIDDSRNVTGNELRLENDWKITPEGSGYAKFSNWVRMEGSGIYTTSTTHVDLDDTSASWSVRGTSNQDLIRVSTADSNQIRFYANAIHEGGIRRNNHHTGYLEGSYNNVGANSYKTNPIYTIGSNYLPTATAFSNMYGIGYSHPNFWGTSDGKNVGWGQYAVEAGVIHFIAGINGTWSKNEFNRNGNKVWDAGNDGPNSGLDADTVDGKHASDFMEDQFLDSAYVDFTVNGDADTYYPVSIRGGGVMAFQMYSISRQYNWTAPNTWYTSTHKGGLTLTWQYSGDGFWGGNDHDVRIIKWDETYSTMVAGIGGSVGGGGTNAGVVVWLRGGGALYRFHGPQASAGDVNIHLTSVTASNSVVFAPRTLNTTTRDNELLPKYPIRNTSDLYDNNNRVWHVGNDGSGSGLDADTLDTYQASQFLRSDAADSATGALTFSGTLLSNGHSSGSNWMPYSDGNFYIRAPNTFFDNNVKFQDGSGSLELTGDSGSNYYMAATGEIRIRPSGTSVNKIVMTSSNLEAPAFTAGGNTVWHAGNDGSGSGLDADTLRTLEPKGSTSNLSTSQIVRSHSNGYIYTGNWIQVGTAGIFSTTTNGAHFYPTNSTYGAWRITGSKGSYTGIWLDYSNVNIGMYDSGGNGGEYSTAATGGWHYYYHRGNRCMGIGGSSTSSSYGLYEQAGGIYSTGNITAYSDRRVKENIVPIDNALEKVNQLEGVYYNRTDDPDKNREIGFIAQDVNEVTPELVNYAEDVDQYGVKYQNTTALLVEAVKELTQQVKDLKAEIEEIKNA